jgi:transketolase
MRRKFSDLLFNEMQSNNKIRLITADLGYYVLDKIKSDLPNQFYNVGASEQLMIGIGIGMAEEGLIPLCYSMSSFVLYRPFEFLRNYVNYENIPVKLVGSGRDKDYEHDGMSHWANDDELVLAALPNIKIYKPKTIDELVQIFPEFLYSKQPAYLNLVRKI